MRAGARPGPLPSCRLPRPLAQHGRCGRQPGGCGCGRVRVVRAGAAVPVPGAAGPKGLGWGAKKALQSLLCFVRGSPCAEPGAERGPAGAALSGRQWC